MNSKRPFRHHSSTLSQCLLLLVISTTFFLTGCNSSLGNKPEPAESGVLDLKDWNFETDGSVELQGEWRFQWGEFLNPRTGTAEEFVVLPGFWNSFEENGSSVGSLGYATYQLRVLLPDNTESLAVRLKEIQTSYRLFLNGEEIAHAGITGMNKEDSRPYYRSLVVGLEPGEEELNFVIHVSNFYHRNGGVWELIELGSETRVRRRYEMGISLDLFLIGFIFAMSLYHIIRFILRRSDRVSLYFGLFCLLIAVRSLIVGNLHAFRIFPGLSWQVLHKIEYITFYAAVPLFLSYLRVAFPSEVNQRILRSVQFAGAAFSLFVLLTPALLYGKSLMAYQIITLLCGSYSLFVLIRASYRKLQGAGIILGGFIFLFIMVINDLLYTNQLIHTGHLMPWGQIIFLLSQAYLIADISARTYRSLVETNSVLAESRLGIILGLSKLAEYRDEDTGIHLERIREYSKLLAVYLAGIPEYLGYITDEYIDDLYHSSILHDIGKVGVPDAILLKPGKLTSGEFNVIKRHARLGGEAIENVEAGMNTRSFLTLGKQVAYNHHEKWDGSGYPEGLAGNDIPLSARIVALADVYDALTSKRPYKDAWSHEKTRELIISEKGKHFDPDVVDAFIANEKRFEEIRREMDKDSGKL